MLKIDTIGAHPATESCLELLQWLQQEAECANILDMGCGNGILSVAAASIWEASVLAVDISEQALEDARGNIAANGLQERITPLRSDWFAAPEIRARAPYDLIIFNVLAEPITRFAPRVAELLAPGGFAILSGILGWLAQNPVDNYRHLGFETVELIVKSPWHSYLMRKTVTEANPAVTKA